MEKGNKITLTGEEVAQLLKLELERRAILQGYRGKYGVECRDSDRGPGHSVVTGRYLTHQGSGRRVWLWIGEVKKPLIEVTDEERQAAKSMIAGKFRGFSKNR